MDNGKSEFITKRIKVYGIVQGVGFRPLVYRIAQMYKITGTVRNIGGYVEIIAQAEGDALEAFISQLKEDRSGSSEIIKLESESITADRFTDFIIVNSKASGEISVIPPDLPVCKECLEELYDKSDRRWQNPFISCTSCGPRYTIIEELPYDRDNTSMKDFKLCPSCNKEYGLPQSRRFHAQTVSCNDCGPYLIYHDSKHTPPDGRDLIDRGAFEKAVSILKDGGILAVKGIGGYHLVCSPYSEDTVNNLRNLKGREEKPFAVMFHSVDQIKSICQVSIEEERLLTSNARPIVLLYMNNDNLAPSVNKGSIYCGAFLPYTPLQAMLTEQLGPLIMTSANQSDQPIIREDDEILSLQHDYLDGILYNQRRIVRSVDDSVARVIDHKPQLIRRSRGYVPYPVFINNSKDITIFAAGGDLKAAFCLYRDGKAVVSQYFGDVEENRVMENYRQSFADLSRLLLMKPKLAVCDLHPNYHSAQFAKTLGIPLIKVQHHHAHVASVMAEHDLRKRVIGVAFDGTGYGTDGNIWGGEFLICEGADFIRAGQLRYMPILGGDRSMKDAKKTASCYLLSMGLDSFIQDNRKDIIKAALKTKVNTVLTSSMGRLFDAAASILDICQENRYEGECAASFEKEAALALRNRIKPEKLDFAIIENSEIIELDPKPVFNALVSLRETKSKGALALGFHYALAQVTVKICERLRDRYKSNVVALSGGVFQNAILTERTLMLLRQRGFETYVNLSVPPNDGAISLGQAYLGLLNTHK